MIELSAEMQLAIIKNIQENIKDLEFGLCAATLRVTDRAIVDITYTKTVSQREYVKTLSTEGK